MKRLLLAVALAFLFGAPAHAKPWAIDYPNSKLTFAGTQTGQRFTGEFSSYIARVDLDLEHPETGSVNVQIDMRTAKTGDAQKDAALPGADWFDSKNYNFAEFTSTKISKVGPSNYVIDGQLKIKLVTKNVQLPFTVRSEADGTRAEGKLVIDRTDYTVGTGEWVSDQYVGKPVEIAVSLFAH